MRQPTNHTDPAAWLTTPLPQGDTGLTEDGKTLRQEADDSARALGYLLLAALGGAVLLAIIIFAAWRWYATGRF